MSKNMCPLCEYYKEDLDSSPKYIKVGEENCNHLRHNLTAYVCEKHFGIIMGAFGTSLASEFDAQFHEAAFWGERRPEWQELSGRGKITSPDVGETLVVSIEHGDLNGSILHVPVSAFYGANGSGPEKDMPVEVQLKGTLTVRSTIKDSK